MKTSLQTDVTIGQLWTHSNKRGGTILYKVVGFQDLGNGVMVICEVIAGSPKTVGGCRAIRIDRLRTEPTEWQLIQEAG